MNTNEKYPPLTAYRVFYNDNTHQDTNMAAHVTLEDAQKYFVGNRFEITENSFRTAIRVEKIPTKNRY